MIPQSVLGPVSSKWFILARSLVVLTLLAINLKCGTWVSQLSVISAIGSTSPKTVTCCRCREPGHMARHCPNLSSPVAHVLPSTLTPAPVAPTPLESLPPLVDVSSGPEDLSTSVASSDHGNSGDEVLAPHPHPSQPPVSFPAQLWLSLSSL